MDITTGTRIKMEEKVFAGYPRSRLIGRREITGTVTKESYGAKRGQHTFTIEVEESSGVDAPEVGKKIRRKGRNVYKNSEILSYPSNHRKLAKEKHQRAEEAKNAKYLNWIEEFIDGGNSWECQKLDRIPDSWFMSHPKAARDLREIAGYDVFGLEE
jgi:hypothetical protein